MQNLTATIPLTLTVLLGGSWVSWGDDERVLLSRQ